MQTNPTEIYQTLKNQLSQLTPPLKIKTDSDTTFELAGTKETMQGKQKVDGIFFTQLVLKPKDVRLYFFPIYTHEAEFDSISENLRKNLKGKSCFHFKKLDADLELELNQLLKQGLAIYQQEGLI